MVTVITVVTIKNLVNLDEVFFQNFEKRGV